MMKDQFFLLYYIIGKQRIRVEPSAPPLNGNHTARNDPAGPALSDQFDQINLDEAQIAMDEGMRRMVEDREKQEERNNGASQGHEREIENDGERQIHVEVDRSHRQVEEGRERQDQEERQRQIEEERQRQIQEGRERQNQEERQRQIEEERQRQIQEERERQVEEERERQVEEERERRVEEERERQDEEEREENAVGAVPIQEEAEQPAEHMGNEKYNIFNKILFFFLFFLYCYFHTCILSSHYFFVRSI